MGIRRSHGDITISSRHVRGRPRTPDAQQHPAQLRSPGLRAPTCRGTPSENGAVPTLPGLQSAIVRRANNSAHQ